MTGRWRSQLEAWALPPELLTTASQSPYGCDPALWQRRTALARREGDTPTTVRLRRLLGRTGTLLDVGAGTGRASLPLAAAGYRLTAVERSPEMLEALRAEAAELGVEVATVEGAWPEVAEQVGGHDVALAAHVVYDVPDLRPFLAAMSDRADRAVVLELTAAHPWAGLGPYYQALHGLDRPAGPTVDDLVAAIAEIFHLQPGVERWSRPGQLWFEDRAELLAFYGRRLLIPARRRDELWTALRPDVVERDGRLAVGPTQRDLATVWFPA